MESTVEAFEECVRAYDFSGAQTVMDVGGGGGGFLVALLRQYPRIRGILFDLPSVIAEAEKHLAATGVAERITMVAGDFFAGVPAGGDIYTLCTILHIFDDEKALNVLQSCRRAMSESAKLVAFEQVVPAGRAVAPLALHDLRMLLLEGGCERTQAEFEALFARAHLRLTRILPIDPPFSAIEGVPV